MDTIELVRHLLDFHTGLRTAQDEWEQMLIIEDRGFWAASWADKVALIDFAMSVARPDTGETYSIIMQNPEGYYEEMACGMLQMLECGGSLVLERDEFCTSKHDDCEEARYEAA